MIARTTPWCSQGEWGWQYAEGCCAWVDADVTPHNRVSALLGPNGEPLKVGYERPKLGFDLSLKE